MTVSDGITGGIWREMGGYAGVVLNTGVLYCQAGIGYKHRMIVACRSTADPMADRWQSWHDELYDLVFQGGAVSMGINHTNNRHRIPHPRVRITRDSEYYADVVPQRRKKYGNHGQFKRRQIARIVIRVGIAESVEGINS